MQKKKNAIRDQRCKKSSFILPNTPIVVRSQKSDVRSQSNRCGQILTDIDRS